MKDNVNVKSQDLIRILEAMDSPDWKDQKIGKITGDVARHEERLSRLESKSDGIDWDVGLLANTRRIESLESRLSKIEALHTIKELSKPSPECEHEWEHYLANAESCTKCGIVRAKPETISIPRDVAEEYMYGCSRGRVTTLVDAIRTALGKPEQGGEK
jgi:hypothetical protein